MTNLQKIIKLISSTHISFLIDIDRTIDIDKSGKYYYFKSLNIDLNNITNFIENLEDDEIYLINPLITIESKYKDLYLTLSRQFLVTNKSNPQLITSFIDKQMDIAQNQIGFEIELNKFVFSL